MNTRIDVIRLIHQRQPDFWGVHSMSSTESQYSDQAEAYAQMDYWSGTYYLISSCLETYLDSLWTQDERVGLQVLDYGCGTGAFIRLLRDFGFKNSIGIDPNEAMLSQAKMLDLSGSYIASKDFSWEEYKNSFDLISSSFVLPALSCPEDLKNYLNKAYHVLKKKGLFFLIVGTKEGYDPHYIWLSWTQNFPENEFRSLKNMNGQKVRVHLKHLGVTLEDIFWSSSYLEESFVNEGFVLKTILNSLGKPTDPFPWKSELSTAPFTIYVLEK